MTIAAEKFVGTLMASSNQAHAFHLVTSSYAIHKALQSYYEGIVPLADSWAEAYMGKYGRLRKSTVKTKIIFCPCKMKMYFRTLLANIRKLKLPKDTYLSNIKDEIIALIRSTQYKLSLH